MECKKCESIQIGKNASDIQKLQNEYFKVSDKLELLKHEFISYKKSTYAFYLMQKNWKVTVFSLYVIFAIVDISIDTDHIRQVMNHVRLFIFGI